MTSLFVCANACLLSFASMLSYGRPAVVSLRTRYESTHFHRICLTFAYMYTCAATEGQPLRLLDAFTLRDDDAGTGILALTIRCQHGEIWFDKCSSENSACNTLVKPEPGGWWMARIFATLEQLQAIMSDVTLIVRPRTSGLRSVFDITLDDRGNTGFGGPLSMKASKEFHPQQVVLLAMQQEYTKRKSLAHERCSDIISNIY